MSQSLELPENFDPDANLIAKITENGKFHESRAGASLAERLVANGTPNDLALAEKVLDATLNCQMRDKDDPHVGNFLWMSEDRAVGDLNAVEFNLERLIPMMLNHHDRLPTTLQQRVLDAIRLGLDEVRRLDVNVAYSNIAMLDILNSCLGGELIGDNTIAQRGYEKMAKWLAYTSLYGIPREYNSTTYTSVIIRALKRLSDHSSHGPTRIRARLMAARLAISAALHIQRKTGRWAGPHSRAYHPSVVGETAPEIERIKEWTTEGHLPPWTVDLLNHPPLPYQITETADSDALHGLTTYLSKSFSLGTATREYSGQSNVMLIQYHRDGDARPGVMYTRYILNDKWFGDHYHATDRTKSRNLIDEGRFYGVQSGPGAIGLYAPGPPTEPLHHSAKAALVFTGIDAINKVWVGQDLVNTFPCNVPQGETVIVSSGMTYIGIKPLARTKLGAHAPARLVERTGDLVLELYNYLGDKKPFWDMQPGGPFFKGHSKCALYVEVAEKGDYDDGASFARTIDSGIVIDRSDVPFTFDGETPLNWEISYARGDYQVGIAIDLMQWKLLRRWDASGVLGWPMLESPVARQSHSGHVTVGDAEMQCGEEAAWLFANPAENRWVAAYHGDEPKSLTLSLPVGSVLLDGIATGVITWDNGKVDIDAVELVGTPQITGGELVPRMG